MELHFFDKTQFFKSFSFITFFSLAKYLQIFLKKTALAMLQIEKLTSMSEKDRNYPKSAIL